MNNRHGGAGSRGEDKTLGDVTEKRSQFTNSASSFVVHNNFHHVVSSSRGLQSKGYSGAINSVPFDENLKWE